MNRRFLLIPLILALVFLAVLGVYKLDDYKVDFKTWKIYKKGHIPRRLVLSDVTDTCTGTTACNFAAGGGHKPGEMAYYAAWRSGTATAPGKPAALFNVTNGTSSIGTARGWRITCQPINTKAAVNSGTFTSATNVVGFTIPGVGAANTTCPGVATVGSANSASSGTGTFNALTAANSGDTAFLFMGSSTSGQTCMPASAASIISLGTANLGIANATGNWATDTCAITSSVHTEVVLDIPALTSIPACTSNCPSFVTYKQGGTTSNSSTPLPADMQYHMQKAVLSGNTLAFALRYFDNTNAITATVTADGTAMTQQVTCHDASGTQLGAYYLANAGGKQNILVTFSSAVGSFGGAAAQFKGVPTSSPIDGQACTMGTTGPYIQAGNITPTVPNDVIWNVGFNDGDNVILNHTSFFQIPYDNYVPLGFNNSIGPLSYYMVYNSTATINPTFVAWQSTANNWGAVSLAFKQSAGTGTAATGMYIARDVNLWPDATSVVEQFPCTGNLIYTQTASGSDQSAISDIIDSDSNGAGTLNGAGSLGAGHYDRFTNGAGLGQAAYAGNASCAGGNTRTMTYTLSTANSNPFHIYDVVGADTSPLDTGITTSDGSVAHSVVTLTGVQTAVAASSTVCSNDPNSNSGVHFTPSTANGIAFINEFTGTGPEACMFGANNNFGAEVFGGENDSCCGELDSSSGIANLPYSSASAQQVLFGWINHGSASPSGWGDMVVAFKAASSTARRRASWVISSIMTFMLFIGLWTRLPKRTTKYVKKNLGWIAAYAALSSVMFFELKSMSRERDDQEVAMASYKAEEQASYDKEMKNLDKMNTSLDKSVLVLQERLKELQEAKRLKELQQGQK